MQPDSSTTTTASSSCAKLTRMICGSPSHLVCTTTTSDAEHSSIVAREPDSTDSTQCADCRELRREVNDVKQRLSYLINQLDSYTNQWQPGAGIHNVVHLPIEISVDVKHASTTGTQMVVTGGNGDAGVGLMRLGMTAATVASGGANANGSAGGVMWRPTPNANGDAMDTSSGRGIHLHIVCDHCEQMPPRRYCPPRPHSGRPPSRPCPRRRPSTCKCRRRLRRANASAIHRRSRR